MENDISTHYLDQVATYATKVITTEFSEKLVYHNIEHAHRVIKGIGEITDAEGIDDLEKEICTIAGWCSLLGFKNLEQWPSSDNPVSFFKECYRCSSAITERLLSELNYPHKDPVLEILKDTRPENEPQTKLGKILSDATNIVWASKKGKSRLELLYQQFLLTDIGSISKSNFYDVLLSYLNEHEYHTEYGLIELTPKKKKLLARIEKEKKEIHKTEEAAIKKELAISDSELKSLKKSLKAVKGRDERGIQTMFRTTSRNHYTLNQMVDRKANIMISINAIILSLIMSRVIGGIETFCIHNFPILIILVSSVISISLAVLAIIPGKTHGEFTEQEIRDKQGNLLYFGNYHNMTFRDYNWGILQMLNDSDYLYTSMIRDQYFLGQLLDKKYRRIRISLVAFLLGIALGSIFFLGVSTMPDFHMDNVAH